MTLAVGTADAGSERVCDALARAGADTAVLPDGRADAGRARLMQPTEQSGWAVFGNNR